MKQRLFVLLNICLLGLAGCAKDNVNNQKVENESETAIAKTDHKVLIAYFSVPETNEDSGVDTVGSASIVLKDGKVKGNMEYMAEIIQRETNGDLFEIIPVQSYPINHDQLVNQAAEEQDNQLRPELASQVKNIEQYDVIFVGYPNWWADLPMPLYTFLEEYDLSGKTIIPFTSHGGSGLSNTINEIQNIQSNATVIEHGLSISRNDVSDSDSEIISWLNELGF